MEDFSAVIQLIAAAISTVLLPLLLIRSKRRQSNAEAERSEAENITRYAAEWEKLYQEKEEKCNELNTKIDNLYLQITTLRDKLSEAQEKNTELKIQNQALEFRKCNKRGCADRMPPSDF